MSRYIDQTRLVPARWSHRPHQPASSNRPRQHGHPPSQPFTRAADAVGGCRAYHAAQRPVKRLHCFHPAVELATPTVSALLRATSPAIGDSSRHSVGGIGLVLSMMGKPSEAEVEKSGYLPCGSPSVTRSPRGRVNVLPGAAPWPPGRLSRGHTVFYVGPHGLDLGHATRTVTQIDECRRSTGAVGAGLFWVAKARSEERPPSECMQECQAKRFVPL